MSSQRYERVSANDNNDSPIGPIASQRHTAIPSSPPPSFRSHESSPTRRSRLISDSDPLVSDAERTLADTFDSPSDDDSDDGNDSHTLDDRQRVLSGRPTSPSDERPTSDENNTAPPIERRVTQLPVFAPASAAGRVYGGGNSVHDGVFANLSAKPERRDEEGEEKPPSYEAAAADATPPYWETTILAPGGTHSDSSVFIDGLPVGSIFSFAWNGLISMSFQLVGFLLTYLLHTTHAAKNGSKAGLGITLVQYGFSLKSGGVPGNDPPPSTGDFTNPPADPNAHDFDPTGPAGGTVSHHPAGPGPGAVSGMHTADWFAYALMVVGWFVLIRSVSEYLKARRHEQLVLQSPSRGLGVPVVGEDEAPAHVV